MSAVTELDTTNNIKDKSYFTLINAGIKEGVRF